MDQAANPLQPIPNDQRPSRPGGRAPSIEVPPADHLGQPALRPSLARIRAYAELLRDGRDLDPETHHEFCSFICRQAAQLEELIDPLPERRPPAPASDRGAADGRPPQVAATERPTTGRNAGTWEAVFEEAAAVFNGLFATGTTTLEVAFPEPSSAATGGDLPCSRETLVRIVIDVLLHAVPSCRPGQAVRLRAIEDGQGRGFEVAGRGEGISLADQRRLLRGVGRIDSARSQSRSASNGRGAERGLVAAYELITSAGGTMSVASRRGNGTRVQVVFPGRRTARHNPAEPTRGDARPATTTG